MLRHPNVAAIGAELEGGWDGMADRWKPYRVSDGSVHTDSAWNGEIRSPIYKTVAGLSDFIRSAYPTEVNETCGLHVHFSFPDIARYERIAVPRFNDVLCAYSRRAVSEGMDRFPDDGGIARFCDRLNGARTHCLPRPPKIEEQIRAMGKPDVRYRAVNYCYGLHGTMEIRLLPMFDKPETAVYYVSRLTKLVDRVAGLASLRPVGEAIAEGILESSGPFKTDRYRVDCDADTGEDTLEATPEDSDSDDEPSRERCRCDEHSCATCHICDGCSDCATGDCPDCPGRNR